MKHALSIRSDFSLGDSLLQLDKLVDKVKSLGYESLALVDTNSVHAMPDFSARCKKAGIKPIVAVTLRVHDDATYRKEARSDGPKNSPSVRLKVYVKDERGMRWLFHTLSKAMSPERFYYHGRVAWEDFQSAEGIAVATGDFFGLFSHENYYGCLTRLVHMVGQDNVYAELCPVDTPLFDTMNHRAIQACVDLGLTPLVTFPALYAERGDADSLDVLRTIIDNDKVSDPWRPKQFVKDFYLQEPAHILDRVKQAAARQIKFNANKNVRVWADGIKAAQDLVDSVSYIFEKMPISLPVMATDEFSAVAQECKKGWVRRFSAPVLGHKPDLSNPAVQSAYLTRLRFELDVLKRMGFSGYFLLAQDIVQWSKTSGIIVGPGRGSVGGSLVAYLMGITDVDPIRFGLLFERFINPDRIDLPDADLDFMSSRRHEVIEYLQKKYGEDKVGGISNYSSMASGSAARDVGRVFGLTNLELSPIKLVPKEHGQPVTLSEASDKVPEIELFAARYPGVWKHALVLEGGMRSLGQHAAGVVVASEPLINRAVVETRSSSAVVCWDKRTVEDFGLVKLDILGLSTLDVLFIAAGYVKDRHGVEVDYLKLPLEEDDIMDAFGRGETTGVFQFESGGMRRLLKDLAKGGRLTFEDITAATALYRPGPMDSGLLDDYVAIKQGIRTPSYDHPCLEDVLSDTYGVVIYQEQTMALSRTLCGFTATEADNLRRAIGKKDLKKMAEMKPRFVEGASAGFVEVTLDNGQTKTVHRMERFLVQESTERFTVEEIMAKGFTLLNSL